MKKILTLCAGLLLVFGLSACDETGELPHPGEEEPDPTTEVEPGEETGGEGTEGGEIGGEEEPDPSDPSSGLLNFESVSFVDSPYTLEVGGVRATQLEVKPEGLDVSVSYTSKQSLIATIDNDGVITGIGEGETEVYATVSAEGYNDAIAIAEVKVEAQHVETDYVKSITFLESNGYTFKVGDTYDFTSANGVYVEVSGSASQDFTLECTEENYTDYFTISGTSIVASKATDSPITLKAIATGDTSKTAETTITITDKDEVTGVEFIDDNGTTTSAFELGLSEGTLDLSSHVRVSGTGDYSNTFTLELTSTDPSGCATLEGNVVTAVSEGTATVTATAGEHTASATITIVDDNVYVEEINFALASYQLWTGEIDSEHPEEMVVGVSVKYTDNSTSSDAYSISIAEGGTSVVSYDETNKTLKAVNDGSTQITATSTDQMKDGSNATATVNVTVSHNDILVSEIHFSSPTWSVKEEQSFTIGPSDSGANVTVTTGPDNADESSWKLETDDSNITITGPDGSGVYTVTANELSISGVTETASITVTPTSGTEGVSDTLSVSIIPYDSDIKYVSSITLNPTTKTINELEEFTIGTSSTDVAVTVEPNDATDPSYTVSCDSTDYIEVTGSGDSWTVKALEGAGGTTEGGQTYDIVVKADDAHHFSTTLALTVNRPEAVASEMTVEGGDNLGLTSHNVADTSAADSIDLRSTLTVKVTDQYGDEYKGDGGSEYTLSTSDTGLIELNDETGVVTAVAGASGTATVIVTSVANTELYESVSITVTPKVYAVESISVDPDTATVAWGGTYTPSVTITPVYADIQGYTITHSDGDEIFTIDGTSLTHNGTAAGSETFTITAEDATNNASCTLTLTVEKELDEPSAVTFTGLESSYEKGATIDNLNSYVEVNYEHDDLAHYEHDGYTLSFESGDPSIISVSETDGTWNATCVSAGTTTLTAVVTPNTDGATVVKSSPVTIQVVISATHLERSDSTGGTLSLVEGETSTLSVSILPTDHTDDIEITWSSSSNAVTVSDTTGTSNTITAVSAGSATITASAGDLGSVTWDVTVTAKLTSYTLSFDIKFSGGSSIYPLPEGVKLYEQYGIPNQSGWADAQQLSGSGSDPYTLTFNANTLPSAGSYTINVYASNPEVESGYYWDHQLGTATWTITGNESGNYTQTISIQSSYADWDSKDGVFPPVSSEDTEFYILMFETTGVDTSKLSSNIKQLNINDSGDFWGSGITYTTSITIGTNSANYDQRYIYNTVAATAKGGTTISWGEFHNGSWSYEMHLPEGVGAVPSDQTGYAVYYSAVAADDWWDGTNESAEGKATTTAWDGQWAENVSDISAFIASFTGSWYN